MADIDIYAPTPADFTAEAIDAVGKTFDIAIGDLTCTLELVNSGLGQPVLAIARYAAMGEFEVEGRTPAEAVGKLIASVFAMRGAARVPADRRRLP